MAGSYFLSSLVELATQSLLREGDSAALLHNIACLPLNLKDGLRETLLKRRTLSARELECLVHPKIQAIDLSEQAITPDHLGVLMGCTEIRKLDLNQASKVKNGHDIVVDEEEVIDLSHQLCQLLSRLQHLTSLHLRDVASVTGDVTSVLGGSCPHLRHLELGGCLQVGDEAVHHLRRLESLESLSLARTSISDLALSSLARAECRACLQELRVNSCPAITDIGIQALLEGLSGLQILIFHGCPQVTDGARVALEEYFAAHGRTVRQVTWTVY